MSCDKARELITEVYDLREVDECIAKIIRTDHQRDFKQEVFLILLETPCDKVSTISQTGGLRLYVFRIIWNLFRQKRNVYNSTYREQSVEYNTDKLDSEKYSLPPAEYDSIGERQRKEDKEMVMITRISQLDDVMGTFYHRELVALIAKYGSMREVSRQLGIPTSSISDSIKKVRKHLSQ